MGTSSQIDADAGRLLAVLLVLAAIGSEPLGQLRCYALYAGLLIGVAVVWRVSLWKCLQRPLQLTPALLLLAVGLPVSRGLDAWLVGTVAPEAFSFTPEQLATAASLFLRAFLAVTLLVILNAAVGWHGVLRGLRRLGLPAAVTLVLEQLERYRQLIASEWRRTSFARDSRSPGRQQFALASYAGQTGMVFLRSWERSERVYAAMLSRGFSVDGGIRGSGSRRQRVNLRMLLQPLWLPALALTIRVAL